MPGTFISYSRKDQDFAKRLAGDLAFHGLDVWWDSWQMRVGDLLDVRIQEAITECTQFVLVLSSNAIESEWVQKELGFALIHATGEHSRSILPALIENVELPTTLSNRVYADFRSSYNQGLDELLKTLQPPIDPSLMNKLLSNTRTHISAAFAAIPGEKRELYIRHVQNKLQATALDEEQMAALNCLATLKHPSAGYALMTKSQKGSLAVRCHAIFLMGESRSREFVGILAGLMSDHHPTVRAVARTASAKIPGSRS
jgi:hypothetical protein